MSVKVSIIVPIYNVEQYIAECVYSLFKQTYKNIEYIFVDDASPDNSVPILEEIIKEYNDRKEQVILIRNKKNEGSSLARKTGFEKSTGEYIICVDSDDYIEPDMVEKMINKALSEDFDIVWCDFFENGMYIKSINPKLNSKIEIFKKLFNGDLHASLCTKLLKKEVYSNGIYFPKAMMIEDVVISIQTLFYAKKIGFLDTAFYHYRVNPSSITQSKSNLAKRTLEFYENFTWIVKFLENKFGDNLDFLEPNLSSRANYIKMEIMRIKETRDVKKIYELYPKSLSLKTSIKYKKPVIFVQIIILFFAKKNILFPYKLFNLLRETWIKIKL